MPEGPEIRQAADQLAEAIAGQVASQVYFAFPHLKSFEPILAGERVLDVEPRGKAMLVRFAGGLSIYSHNQLYGRWFVRPAGQRPATRRQLRLAVHTPGRSALLYSASEIDVLDEDGLAAQPYLSSLGPDVLAVATRSAQIRRRLEDDRFRRRQLGALLLDQGFTAGLGNYLRSEILFVAGLRPELRPADCRDDELALLARSIRNIPLRAYRTKGITNDPARVKALRAQGVRRSQLRHHVFARGGRPCYACGARIRKTTSAGRRVYFCPRCQRGKGRTR